MGVTPSSGAQSASPAGTEEAGARLADCAGSGRFGSFISPAPGGLRGSRSEGEDRDESNSAYLEEDFCKQLKVIQMWNLTPPDCFGVFSLSTRCQECLSQFCTVPPTFLSCSDSSCFLCAQTYDMCQKPGMGAHWNNLQ